MSGSTLLECDDKSGRVLLAIESSCDETAAAVIREDNTVLANVVSSQHDFHEQFGGVVPEIASRAHVRNLLPVINAALTEANVTPQQLSAIAVTSHPGLVGSLLVGVTAAKTFAATWELPLITVDHVQAHLYACQMSADEDVYPAIGLVVSGGHSNLYDCRSALDCELIGSTIDDAVGEAFDKAARILGLPYPGGPSIQKAALSGNPKAFKFPRPMADSPRLAFSFSGLKTALLYEANGLPGGDPAPALTPQRVADLAASFQAAAIEVIVRKVGQAVKKTGHNNVCVGGGVAANQLLRELLEESAEKNHFQLFLAPWEYCTDNAAMAALAWEQFHRGEFAALDCDVQSGLVRLK
ncbi:tRNA (adenosine(37)-N6)-threonylcarbamoyltransferase complex transferase subunit TsaD [Calycomorphotria hydatis]|uniref:tRNA N6-adenosine threonylcarbamoyltransferase n=1 Tax=Calycomorphotria hydatis TaxID=2528027 RepID=A0A517T9G5_9PLAN|nr:tRNA (adenosine(37)-N6)-threonylcarbamoyltransferase complex transferase subunit TsaD [Calycomorphotria hydatis]QDT65006.1 tRNA N6-adenosine threonylcarbamoyltransferase [Calycomorphotria hydatis]